uniref:Putative secreted protein n=1 Tax=Amblyomma triste TaxID=251400 RepID=A0A023G4K2_AMBTT
MRMSAFALAFCLLPFIKAAKAADIGLPDQNLQIHDGMYGGMGMYGMGMGGMGIGIDGNSSPNLKEPSVVSGQPDVPSMQPDLSPPGMETRVDKEHEAAEDVEQPYSNPSSPMYGYGGMGMGGMGFVRAN